MKSMLIPILTVTLLMFSGTTTVFAHGGAEPMHGGLVQIEHDMTFELVRAENELALYLRDHGEPYLTSGIEASVIVLAKGVKSDAKLTPAGDNKMTAAVQVPDGAKVLVKVKEVGHHAMTVRFSY